MSKDAPEDIIRFNRKPRDSTGEDMKRGRSQGKRYVDYKTTSRLGGPREVPGPYKVGNSRYMKV